MAERVAESDDAAVAREPQLDLVLLIALLRRREQVLVARLDEPHGPAERAGQPRDQDVLGVDDALRAEAAANVPRHDAHGVLADPEIAREDAAMDLGRLARRPRRQWPSSGVPARG